MEKAIIRKVLEKAIPAECATFEEIEMTDINSGGCGYFAYHLASKLQSLGVDAKVYCFGQRWCYGDPNRKVYHRLKREYLEDMPNGHILVKVGNTFYDSEGPQADTRWENLENYGPIRLDYLEDMLRIDMWNDNFDPDLGPLLADVIEEAFTYETFD